MKEEYWEKLRVAIDELDKAHTEWDHFLMVELREATLTPEMQGRIKQLRAREKTATEKVRKIQELLGQLED